MTFTYEKIDQQRASEIRSQVLGDIYAFQMAQVIDRERDLVFVNLGGQGDLPQGQGDSPTYFNLFWKGNAIAFQGYWVGGKRNGVVAIDLDITAMAIPTILKGKIAEIQEAIQESMGVYWGALLRTTIIVEVNYNIVNFF